MNKVLLATDIHPRSDRVLERAAMLASDLDAELHIRHVIESNRDGALEIAQSELNQLTGKEGVFRTAIATANPVVPTLAALEGNAADVITDQIAELHPRLVVMGLGRDFTMSKIFKGSTVDRIVASGAVSVLVVKTRPVSMYKNCAVCFDGSPESRAALEAALWAAPHAAITIIHATTANIKSPSELDDVEDRVGSHVRTILQEFAAQTHQLPRDLTLHIGQGDASDVVLDYVRDANPDLVALGRTRKTGFKTLVPGSTTSLLLAHLTRDTIIAGPPR